MSENKLPEPTLGPWTLHPLWPDLAGDGDGDGYKVVAKCPCPKSPQGSARMRQWETDARLMIDARNDLPRLRALNDELVRALKLALYMLFPYEPEDSRAVSEEFVALAAVSCGIGDEKTSAVIAAALARAGEQS